MAAEREAFNLLMLEEGEWLLQDAKCILYVFRKFEALSDDDDVIEEIETGCVLTLPFIFRTARINFECAFQTPKRVWPHVHMHSLRIF